MVSRTNSRHYPYLILLLIVVSILLTMFASVARANVTVYGFKAVSQDKQVMITWYTGMSTNTAGFRVLRYDQQKGEYKPLNENLIFYINDVSAEYIYTDTAVVNGTTFWYKLQEIETDGTSLIHEPAVSAIPRDWTRVYLPSLLKTYLLYVAAESTPTTPAVTGSPTSVLTLTPTYTPIPATNTSIPSSGSGEIVRFPTQPAVHQPTATTRPPATTSAGKTPIASPVLTRTQGPTPRVIPTFTRPAQDVAAGPTATLIPLPTISLLLPTDVPPTDTPQSTPSPTPTPIASRVSPARLLPVILLLGLWALLGAWFFISQRRAH
jgi:hypothetical protein